MNIFMFTSVPMSPPWDQGDKNLAYALTRALPDICYRVLTQRQSPQPLGTNLITERFYWSRNPSLAQKAYVFSRVLIQGSVLASAKEPSKVDLYHLIYRPYPLSSRFLSWLPDFHHTPTIHTVPATAIPTRLKKDLFFARRNVVLSQYGYDRLTKLGLDNVVHIPPGISLSEWEISYEQGASYKQQLEVSGRPVVLFPGHYGAGMGSDMMLQAMPQLIRCVPNVVVIFACRHRSSNDQQRELVLKDSLRQLGLLNSARFYTRHDDMKFLLGASDLVALPLISLKDKLDIPTTLLEFMAMGKPVVITDLPPMNEILNSASGGSTGVGLAVPPKDPQALAQSLINLLQDEKLRERL